jgi:hypothetical protein
VPTLSTDFVSSSMVSFAGVMIIFSSLIGIMWFKRHYLASMFNKLNGSFTSVRI